LLDDIKRAKQEALQANARAKERERRVQLIETDLRYQLAGIEEARRTVIADTRALMQQELERLRQEIEQTRRRLGQGAPFGGSTHEQFLAEAQKEIARRQRSVEEVDRNVIVPGGSSEQLAGPIEVGDRVWVPNLQASG